MSDKNKPKEDPISRAARNAERVVIQDGLDNHEHLDHPSSTSWDNGNVLDFGEVDLKSRSSLPPHPGVLPNDSPPESIDKSHIDEPQQQKKPQIPRPNPVAYQPTPKPITRPTHPMRATTGKINPAPTARNLNTKRRVMPFILLACIALVIGAIVLGIGYWSEREEQKQKNELELLDQKSRDVLLDSAVKNKKDHP